MDAAAERAALARRVWTLFQARDWKTARTLLADDFQAWWPHSREHFATPDAFIGVNRAYPEPWTIHVRHAHATADGAVVEARVAHPGGHSYCCSVARIDDGRIRELVEYWADDDTIQPDWRAPFARRFDLLPD